MLKLSTCLLCFLLLSCTKGSDEPEPDPKPTDVPLTYSTIKVNGLSFSGSDYTVEDRNPRIEVSFSTAIDKTSAPQAVRLLDKTNNAVNLTLAYSHGDSLITIQPSAALDWLSKYTLTVSGLLKSKSGTSLLAPAILNLTVPLDSTDKLPRISDDELLTKVQQQTFKYFWEFGHPVSGMARERTTSGNTVTTGGTGFGIMAMIAAANRGYAPRLEVTERIQKIVSFLKNNCTSYHGAFAHWVNGETGETIAFSTKDNGADLVETSFLFQGLLTARQYFKGKSTMESQLRDDITQLWEAMDWQWFQKEGENALYWHWSSTYGWEKNMKITGWNECLITYVLAASSPTHAITKEVYTQGWAKNGNMQNGSSFYGTILPLGPNLGGPIFFTHYSFLGLNPNGLKDQYADYFLQNKNHALINHKYCVENPQQYLGYSTACWGLTASDGNAGYNAHSPSNDKGVIAPTAALASMPYTPKESMDALHFFYYKLGDKLWKEYGFVDAFNLTAGWYDNQYLAIDQGPIVVMIENYRTGLLWNLFMSSPEVQAGLDKLNFQYTKP